MTQETKFRLPRLPHLPEYKTPQNQADEAKNQKDYQESLHRALQEGLIQIDTAIGPGGNQTSPLTTKGDVWGYNTTNARIPVGTDGYVLTADSTNSLGVSYQAAATGTPTVQLPATQALSAGDLVNIFSSSGTPSVRKASATSGYEAHGFTNAAVLNAGTCTVQLAGLNTHSSGLTAGRVFLHTTDGLVSNTCPSTAGQMGQEVGEAYSSTSYNFAWHPGVLLATTHSVGSAGTLQGQEFTASGTFTVPANVSSVWVTMIGGGGGGGTHTSALGGGGGGAGELVQNLAVLVTASGSVTVTIGAKGTGAIANGTDQSGVAGGTTSFGSVYKALGGSGAVNTLGGTGGGVGGGVATSTTSVAGIAEACTYFGGGSGGPGASTTTSTGVAGAGSGGYSGAAFGSPVSTQGGGGGGASTIWGLGGAGGNGGSAGTSAASTSYGSGGGGAGGKTGNTLAGGDGCAGYCLVQWVA